MRRGAPLTKDGCEFEPPLWQPRQSARAPLEFSKRALLSGSRQNRTEMLMRLAQIIDFRRRRSENLNKGDLGVEF
jgi:hypothetical protein